MTPFRIALIEDNPADVHLVELALKESGIPYELTLYDNGEDGAKALCPEKENGQEAPDVILLDLKTPRSDGFEVLTKMRQCAFLNETQIAVLTTSDAPSDKMRVILQGVRYIHKPSQLRDFLAIVGGAVKEMVYG